MTQNVDLRLAPSALKREAKATLVQACTDHGLAVDGTKDQLIARLKVRACLLLRARCPAHVCQGALINFEIQRKGMCTSNT
eukprot:1146568-Pelagomonas_calceolata.AAC.1